MANSLDSVSSPKILEKIGKFITDRNDIINACFELSKRTHPPKHNANIQCPSWFIISYGPPASGKGSIQNLVLDVLGISGTVIFVNVDAYVEYLYKTLVKINNQKITQKDYWELRQIADGISNDVMKKAKLQRVHIIWETTGNSIEWTLGAYIPLFNKDYKIALTMPMVELGTIIARCKNREQAANCDEKYIRPLRNSANSNFQKVAEKVDRVILYNNSNTIPELIFDSETKPCTPTGTKVLEEFPEINKYLKIKCLTGSGITTNMKNRKIWYIDNKSHIKVKQGNKYVYIAI